jgi:hypothetical protein
LKGGAVYNEAEAERAGTVLSRMSRTALAGFPGLTPDLPGAAVRD